MNKIIGVDDTHLRPIGVDDYEQNNMGSHRTIV